MQLGETSARGKTSRRRGKSNSKCYIYYPNPVPTLYQSQRKASFPSVRLKDNDSFSLERQPIMASASSSSDNATKETPNPPDPVAAAMPVTLPNVSQNSQNPSKGKQNTRDLIYIRRSAFYEVSQRPSFSFVCNISLISIVTNRHFSPQCVASFQVLLAIPPTSLRQPFAFLRDWQSTTRITRNSSPYLGQLCLTNKKTTYS